MLCRGLKFITAPVTRETLSGACYSMTSVNLPEESIKNLILSTPVTRENTIRRQLLNDFSKYARRINEKPHPFPVKSDWDTVQPSVALETFSEEVKFELRSNQTG